MKNKALPRRKNMLVFGQPLIGKEEIDEVVDSLKKSWPGTGPKVQRFENQFARYKGIEHSAAVNSCTAALHLSCLALDLKPGDEVITSAMTFCATINAIIHAGATPVLADIDPETLNIAPKKIEKKITEKTKAVLIVHFAGRPCAMDEIIGIAEKNNLAVIEDCAHAIESEYKGRKTGTFGTFGCFSFYATKNITTGEGGMVISRNKELMDKIKTMALHGLSKDAWKRYSDEGYQHYLAVDRGFKYNMMDLQAAIGIHQLNKVEDHWQKRKNVWDVYMSALKDSRLGLPATIEPDTRHAYHLFTVRINERKIGMSRDRFLQAMHERNIGMGVHYIAIPEHPYYQKSFGWSPSDYPNAHQYGCETASLPLSAGLSDKDLDDVVSAVKDIL